MWESELILTAEWQEKNIPETEPEVVVDKNEQRSIVEINILAGVILFSRGVKTPMYIQVS